MNMKYLGDSHSDNGNETSWKFSDSQTMESEQILEIRKSWKLGDSSFCQSLNVGKSALSKLPAHLGLSDSALVHDALLRLVGIFLWALLHVDVLLLLLCNEISRNTFMGACRACIACS